MSRLQDLLQHHEEIVKRLYVDEQKTSREVCDELINVNVRVSPMTLLAFLKSKGWNRTRKERKFGCVCEACGLNFRSHSGSTRLCNSCRPIRLTIFKLYGLVQSQYDEIFQRQDGKCAICLRDFKEETPSVDHCHQTGLIRGLLCFSCNPHLGKVEQLGGFAAYVKLGTERGIVPHPNSAIARALVRFGSCTTDDLIRIFQRDINDGKEDS